MSLCAPVYQCILCPFLRLMLNYFKIVKWNYKNDKNGTPKRFIEIFHRFCGSGVKFGPPEISVGTHIFSQKVL